MLEDGDFRVRCAAAAQISFIDSRFRDRVVDLALYDEAEVGMD